MTLHISVCPHGTTLTFKAWEVLIPIIPSEAKESFMTFHVHQFIDDLVLVLKLLDKFF